MSQSEHASAVRGGDYEAHSYGGCRRTPDASDRVALVLTDEDRQTRYSNTRRRAGRRSGRDSRPVRPRDAVRALGPRRPDPDVDGQLRGEEALAPRPPDQRQYG